MKKIVLGLIICISFNSIYAQPDTLWTKLVGGPGYESILTAFILEQSASMDMDINDAKELFVLSKINTPGGYISNIIGSTDCWIIKMNSDGDTLWTRVFGGGDAEYPRSIASLNDGGCVIAGYTFSNDGDLIGHHGDNTITDGFIARLDSVGNTVWSKQYGGSILLAGVEGQDKIERIKITKDGNILTIGNTNSQNGDFSLDMTQFQTGWLMTVSIVDGTILQIKKEGSGLSVANSFSIDNFKDIYELSDSSGYIAVGETSYEISSFAFAEETYLCKFDYSFNKVWQVLIGNGNGSDTTIGMYRPLIVEGNNNEIMFAADIKWRGGKVTSPHYGMYDTWVAKLDSVGTILSQTTYGGANDELIYSLDKYNNTFYVGGSTNSGDGYFSDSLGLSDMWVASFDANLDTNWVYRIGGTKIDHINSIYPVNDTIVYIAGITESNDNFMHNNNGGRDIFVSKLTLFPINTSIAENKINDSNLYPNPTNGVFYIETKKGDKKQVTVRNLVGQTIYESALTKQKSKIDISAVENGIYLVVISDEQGNILLSKKVVKLK